MWVDQVMSKNENKSLHVGDVVIFTDSENTRHNALITYVYPNEETTIKLAYVDSKNMDENNDHAIIMRENISLDTVDQLQKLNTLNN